MQHGAAGEVVATEDEAPMLVQDRLPEVVRRTRSSTRDAVSCACGGPASDIVPPDCPVRETELLRPGVVKQERHA